MNTKRFLRTLLSLSVAVIMAFTPIVSTGETISSAAAQSNQPSTDTQSVTVASGSEQDSLEENSTQPLEEETAEQPSQDADAVTEDDTSAASASISQTKTKYTYTDRKAGIKVTAVLQDADAIPDDAELIARPVTKNIKDYTYQEYMDALNASGTASYDADNTLLYDVAFIKDGAEL